LAVRGRDTLITPRNGTAFRVIDDVIQIHTSIIPEVLNGIPGMLYNYNPGTNGLLVKYNDKTLINVATPLVGLDYAANNATPKPTVVAVAAIAGMNNPQPAAELTIRTVDTVTKIAKKLVDPGVSVEAAFIDQSKAEQPTVYDVFVPDDKITPTVGGNAWVETGLTYEDRTLKMNGQVVGSFVTEEFGAMVHAALKAYLEPVVSDEIGSEVHNEEPLVVFEDDRVLIDGELCEFSYSFDREVFQFLYDNRDRDIAYEEIAAFSPKGSPGGSGANAPASAIISRIRGKLKPINPDFAMTFLQNVRGIGYRWVA
jgi:hypothetical protein